MKGLKTGLVIILAGLFGCTKTIDVPSLDESKEGVWSIDYFVEERYQPVSNSVVRYEHAGKPGDYMNFERDKVFVHFDSTGIEEWSCKIVDHNTLSIEGKKWEIVTLNQVNFHLSLNERDSSLKHRDIVRFVLKRP